MTTRVRAGAMTWDEDLESWVVTDPVAAKQVLNHPGFSSQTSKRLGELYMSDEARERYHELTEFLRLWFVHTDAPEHAALRRPVQRLLSAGYVRSLAGRVTEIVDDCLDELAAARPHDVVPTVAEAVSGRVMAHIVGIDQPPPVLHEWSRTLSGFIGAMYRRDLAGAAQQVMLAMTESLATAPASEGFPRDTPQDRARTTATWAMILFGGLETTASLLGSTVLAVLGDATAWAAVRQGDDAAITAFVESVLRRRPPLRQVCRVVAEDLDFAGNRLHAGDLVMVALDSAGLFAEDTDRLADAGEPASHLVFGHGVHYCIGAPLARMEAATLLRRFGQRFPAARLADDAAVWGPNPSYVGLDHLYVELAGGR